MGSVTYQFLKESSVIQTSELSTIQLSNVEVTDSGNYSCSVTVDGVPSLPSEFIELNISGMLFFSCHDNP